LSVERARNSMFDCIPTDVTVINQILGLACTEMWIEACVAQSQPVPVSVHSSQNLVASVASDIHTLALPCFRPLAPPSRVPFYPETHNQLPRNSENRGAGPARPQADVTAGGHVTGRPGRTAPSPGDGEGGSGGTGRWREREGGSEPPPEAGRQCAAPPLFLRTGAAAARFSTKRRGADS